MDNLEKEEEIAELTGDDSAECCSFCPFAEECPVAFKEEGCPPGGE
jgi:hypothetical protein